MVLAKVVEWVVPLDFWNKAGTSGAAMLYVDNRRER
jgi:hypothetical protein